jgi:predicted enzyme related to lactoylglutathione lyase
MAVKSPLRGLTQVNLPADDVAKVRDWYSRFLGMDPYFQQPDEQNPAYVEFRIGDDEDELGIIERKYLPPGSEGVGVIARWHVDDLQGTVDELKGLGATEHEPLTERSGGFATASVVDPFGNVLGLIRSPHYADNIARRTRK